MAGRRVRAVLLDAGGTLFRRVPSTAVVIAEALRTRGHSAPPERLHAAFHAAILAEGVPGPDGEAAQWRRVMQNLLVHAGVPPDEDLADLVGDALERAPRVLYPDVEPALDSLAARGLRLAVVSNFTHALPRILSDLGVSHRFDAVVYSWKAGFAKPDPRIYRLALEALSLDASEAVMVGDSEEHDVAGAEACGIEGFLLDRECAPDGRRLRALTDLPGRLGHDR